MKLSTLYPAVLACGLTLSAFAGNSSPAVSREPAHYSKAELAQLRKEAHTPEQYRALAAYFEHRKVSFQDQAAQMKDEWNRRSQNVVGSAAKYPRPVDSARNLYEYYTSEADEAGVLQAQYEHLADSATQAASTANPSH
jgi:hypothetical protein